jgi:transposase InsO family protein
MDTARYARFQRPGHRVTGRRSTTYARMLEQPGYDFAHVIVDDHSRLAYVELHSDERAQTVTAFVARALDWFAAQGINTRRLMSDNAWSYARNRSLHELLAARQVKHLRTQPYRPQTNGKVERFHQTMAREWAYGLSYRSHHHRSQALPHWLEHYNTRRPHSGIENRPPISRVHNLRGQDS